MKKMRAYLNVLKFRVNMRLKRKVVNNYPVMAIIEPNLFCNLRCPACPTGAGLGLRPKVSIKEEFFRSVMDEVGDYLFHLDLYNWGEPLLHKRTPEMISYAKEKSIRVSLSTNLSVRLSDDYLERLVRSGLDYLIVAMDGTTKETYGKYRRGGDFDLVRENILRLQRTKQRLQSKTPTIIWQFKVFRHNEHEIETVKSVHREWGADAVDIGPAMMPLEEFNDGFEPSSIPAYNWYHPDNSVQLEAVRQTESGRACSWLYGALVLNPGGTVSPCCSVPSEQHDFGRLEAGGRFFDTWNSEKFKRARALFSGPREKSTPRAMTEAENHRIDGMAAGVDAALGEDELICEKCPIPFLQNKTEPVIADAVQETVAGFFYNKSVMGRGKSFLGYVLMGMPDFGRVAQRAIKGAARRLHLASAERGV